MSITTILAVYLGLFIIDFLIDWTLDILNLNASLRNRDAIPTAFTGQVEAGEYSRSIDYTLRKGRFGLFRSAFGRVLLLAVLFTGAAGFLDSLISGWNLPSYLHGLLFLLLASAALSLMEFPLSLYSRFVIEEEFGFNTLTMKTMLIDALKGAVLGTILIAALLAGLYGALAWTGRMWWLAAWGFWAAFQLLMVVLYPLVIAPLFNKFEPLPEGSLRNRLEALAERNSFANSGIFVMDGSKRSRHSNAYFTGIGKARRIVIFDTLVESLKEDELEAVLAHEIGHWKHGHIRKSLAITMGLSLVLFALVGRALNWEPLFAAFGLGVPSLHLLLFWLTFFSSPIAALFTPLGNRRSRRHEYQADAFAANAVGTAESMKRALISLGRDNLSNLTPHPAYSAWHYSHPALTERLAALEPTGSVSAADQSEAVTAVSE